MSTSDGLPEQKRLTGNNHLLNRSATKQAILDRLQKLRPELAKRMTRVSSKALNQLEARFLNLIDEELRRLPSVGKTVTFG